MRKRNSSILLLLSIHSLLFCILLTGIIYMFIRLENRSRQQFEKETLRGYQHNLRIAISIYKRYSMFIFRQFINTEIIQHMIHDAWKSGKGHRRNVLRQNLFKKLNPLYRQLRKDYFRQVHFHFPDTGSFLRMHRPQKYGDILKNVRESVRLANKRKEIISGFEEGRIYNGYRFVYPLFYKQEHCGSVEVSVSMGSVIQAMRDIEPMEYHFLIPAHIVKQKVFKTETKNYLRHPKIPNFLIDKKIFHQNQKIFKNHQAIPESDFLQIRRRMHQGKNFIFPLLSDKFSLYVAGLRILNFKKKISGYLLMIVKKPASIKTTHFKLFGIILVSVLLLLFVLIITIIRQKHYIKMLAMYDNLTGIMNRHAAIPFLRKEISRSKRHGHPLSVIMFDIDHFKKINDRYGHPAGDIVLKTIAQLTRENIRTSDYFIRWGGEEFIIILPVTDTEGSLFVAEMIRSKIESNNFPVPGSVTSSFGVHTFTGGAETLEEIIQRADDQLYRAKEAGRNRVMASVKEL